METWALTLARGLGRLGAEVVVASRDERGDQTSFSVTEDRGAHGGTVFWIAHRHADARSFRDTWDDDRMEAALRSVVRAARPDVIHLAHPDGFGVAPLRLARQAGVPLVVTLHDAKWFCGRGQLVRADGGVCAAAEEETCVRCLGDQLGRGPVRGALSRRAPAVLKRWASPTSALEGRRDPGAVARRRWRAREAALATVLDGADAVLSPSQFFADLAARHGCTRPVQVVPNGIDGPTATPLAPTQPLRVGWFGVPAPTKGLTELIAATADGGCALHVHGADEPGVSSLLGGPLPRHVLAHGPYAPDGVFERMESVDLVALPSRWPENQPMVALEARAAGRPLAVADVGGLPELVRHGVDGWVVPAGGWRAQLRELAANPSLLSAAVAAASPVPDGTSLARAHARVYQGTLGPLAPALREPRPV